MLGLGLQHDHVANGIECRVFDGGQPAMPSFTLFQFGDLVHDMLPCPAWPGMVSDREWNSGAERVERRGNGCQGGGSTQVDRERPYMSQTKLTMRQIQEILRLKHQNQLSIREIARSCGLPSARWAIT
jgi:hypothetical protein